MHEESAGNNISSGKKLFFLLSAVLVILVLSVYIKTFNFGIVNHDDYSFVVGLHEKFKAEGAVKGIFTNTVFMSKTAVPYYRPLMTFSFYLADIISGDDISFAANHAANVIIHLLFVLLLFYFLQKYCFNNVTSFFAAAIFSVHFILIDAVAWVSGRNDSLMAVFALTSFVFFIRYNENAGNKILNLILHCVFYFAALLTKESAAVIPLVCFAYMFVKKYPLKNCVYVFWAGLTLLFLFLRHDASGNKVFWNQLFNMGLLKSNLYMICDYLSVSFGLSKIEIYSEENIFTWMKGLFVFFVLFAGSYFAKNRKHAYFYLFFAFVFLLPNFFINRVFFQGNRMYLPFMGLVVCLFYIAEGYLKTALRKKIAFTAASLVLLTLTLRTSQYVYVYKNERSYFTELKANGNSEAAYMYVLSWINIGLYDKAVFYMEEILNESIDNKKNISRMVDIYITAGIYDKAARLLENKEYLFSNKKRCYEIILLCYEKAENEEKAVQYADKLNAISEPAAE